jgi:fibronectin type 3 domain-containing protein
MKKVYYIIVFLFAYTISFAQSQDTATVRIMAREQNDRVLLRWGVDRAVEWHRSNQYGFTLEKFLFSKDGQRLDQPQLLWSKNIKTEPYEAWEQIVQEDNYAAIIAQALFGESFLVEEGSQGKIADIINLSEELEQRFSFSLLAADMSFQAAVKAGWGYTDTEVKKGEVYIYRIATAVPKEIAEIESSATLVNIELFEPLPKPMDLTGIWGDKNVLLTWDYQSYKNLYTSYNIERSEDGKNFTALSETPLVNVNDKPDAPAKRMYYIDSLAQNDKKYYYRVYGISSFGEKSSYSDIISGAGIEDLLHTPAIVNYTFTEQENEAIIEWEFPKEGEKNVEKFQLNHSLDDKRYKVVVDNISPDKRKLKYSGLDPSNYFTITAIGKNNQSRTSFSALVQPIDSIPPVPPIQLKGEIDSIGIVRIAWKPNEEKDLLGYRIFRGNLEEEEYSQITIEPVSTAYYVDSVNINSLNPKVFYRVVAVDHRFNNSGFSEILAVEKPKIIPPTSPVFKSYSVENGEVYLGWVLSSTQGNIKHQLFRKPEGAEIWEKILETRDTITAYKDQKVQKNKVYNYIIKAVNEVGLESSPSPELTIKVVNLRPTEIIKEIRHIVSRERNYIELFWSVNQKEQIEEFTIYKNNKESEPTTWKILPGNLTRIVDTNINPGKTYIYHIRATLKDGTYSNVKSIEVNY